MRIVSCHSGKQAGYIHIETWYFFQMRFSLFVCCGAEMWVDRVEVYGIQRQVDMVYGGYSI
jgi:hypothetical protein